MGREAWRNVADLAAATPDWGVADPRCTVPRWAPIPEMNV